MTNGSRFDRMKGDNEVGTNLCLGPSISSTSRPYSSASSEVLPDGTGGRLYDTSVPQFPDMVLVGRKTFQGQAFAAYRRSNPRGSVLKLAWVSRATLSVGNSGEAKIFASTPLLEPPTSACRSHTLSKSFTKTAVARSQSKASLAD